MVETGVDVIVSVPVEIVAASGDETLDEDVVEGGLSLEDAAVDIVDVSSVDSVVETVDPTTTSDDFPSKSSIMLLPVRNNIKMFRVCSVHSDDTQQKTFTCRTTCQLSGRR